ncbi:hypothetical protein [Enterococcus sp.]|uniref:hypothetical protein n=1 Tax=Enterococcus sp. TaxID=35783 RepID=UPI002648655D|nr:hypothetical protein [Enterococcus sp.]
MVFVKKATGIVLVSLLFICNGSSLVGVHAEGTPEGSNHNETTASNEQSLKTLTSSDEFLEDLSADDDATKKTTTSTEASATTESSAAKNESGEEQEATASSSEATEVSTEETTGSSVEQAETFAIGVKAVGEGTAESPRIVENESELKTAIEVDKVSHIKLAPASEPNQVFALTSSGRIGITNDMTIDGNGRTVSYTSSRAFEVNTAGIYVTFKNITFGSTDFTVPADEYYGFCRIYGRTNVTLEVENVNYYSNRGAQPFFNRNTGGKIIFSGTNEFIVSNGTSAQEFSEANSYLFRKDSQTTVRHSTGYARAVRANGELIFELEENAQVDFTTNSPDFAEISTDGARFTVGKNANLKINGETDFSNNNSRNVSFDIQDQAKVTMTFGNAINISSDSTLKVGKGATLDLKSTNDSRIFRSTIPPENFVVDNALRMTFNVSDTRNGEPLNTGFTFSDFMKDVTSYGITASGEPIASTVQERDKITSNGTNLTLSNASTRADFTTEEKTAIRGATSMIFQRLPNPSVVLNVRSVIRDTTATFTISDYLSNSNTITKAIFRLYDKEKSPDDLKQDSDSDLVEEKTLASDALTSKLEFTDLDAETDYWLYVQLKTNFDSTDSEWYSVPFVTKSSLLSVSIPTSMFFTTEMDESGNLYVQSPSYAVKNNSAYFVDVSMASFEEESKGNVELVDGPQTNNTKDLWWELTKNREQLTTLKTDLSNVPISKLDTDERSELRFAGEYYGPGGREVNVAYKMTLKFERAED